MRQQKAKIDWLKYEGGNSKFSHLVVKGRQRMEKITALKNDKGSWWYDLFDLQQWVTNFYLKLYTDDGVLNQLPVNSTW